MPLLRLRRLAWPVVGKPSRSAEQLLEPWRLAQRQESPVVLHRRQVVEGSSLHGLLDALQHSERLIVLTKRYVTRSHCDVLSDAINLRCFNQKQRFGSDFLQPIDRYITSPTSPTVQDRDANLVANPIFTDLDRDDAISSVREASLVLVAGIVSLP